MIITQQSVIVQDKIIDGRIQHDGVDTESSFLPNMWQVFLEVLLDAVNTYHNVMNKLKGLAVNAVSSSW